MIKKPITTKNRHRQSARRFALVMLATVGALMTKQAFAETQQRVVHINGQSVAVHVPESYYQEQYRYTQQPSYQSNAYQSNYQSNQSAYQPNDVQPIYRQGYYYDDGLEVSVLSDDTPSSYQGPSFVYPEQATPSETYSYNQPTYSSPTPYTPPSYETYTPPSYGQSQSSHSSAYISQMLSEHLGARGMSSAAVLVYDLLTGQPIYSKNAYTRRSIASITKMMTAMVVLDAMLDMREELMISADDLRGAKNASTRLRVGDRLSRSEFMLMMLMKSENPAAKTLANHYPGGFDAFIAAMNQKARSLGMYDTHFSDSSGLNPRNVSSANDLAKMMREVATNPRYQTIRNFSTARSYDFGINNYNSGSRTYSAANTSSLVRSGNHPIMASKTGFIREAGYCVVMETHVNGRPAIVVLLGAKNSQQRWSDAGTVLGGLAML